MLATTKMSSKGQIVIPEEIRKRLNLKEGAQFVVVAEDGVVVLKAIAEPSIAEFDVLVQRAREQAKQAGLKRTDINAAVAQARNTKKRG